MAKFSDDIKTILQTARQAPSSHNTQPWKVQLQAAIKTVVVGFDPARHLTVGDPDRRELYISLGCFIESLVLAASEVGYAATVTFKGKPVSEVVQISFKSGKASPAPWSSLIHKRRSDRRFYEDTPLPAAVFDELSQLTEGKASLQLFREQQGITHLATATHSATFTAMSNPAFRSELAGWIRNNWTKKPDGMPAYVQGIPGPISLIAKLVIKKNKAVAKDQAKKDSARISHSAAVGLIYTPEQAPKSWVDAGRLYQRACLIAARHDVKTAGLSAAIVDPATTKQLVKALGLPATPVALLRFGYTKNTPKASPRLSLSHFVTEV